MRKLLIAVPLLLSLSVTAQDKLNSALPNDYIFFSKAQKVDWLLENLSWKDKIQQMNTSPIGGKSYKQPHLPAYGLPGFQSCDGPRGAKYAGEPEVCFPVALALAASWDTTAVYQIGQAFSKQLIHKKANQLFAPGLNIIRHPLAGRNSEYFSEDPYLTGIIAKAEVMGIQSLGCIATPKHYALNSFEIGRFVTDITVDERVMREIYLPAFRTAIIDGKAKSVMSAYNSINGAFASANYQLLDILNKEWGFKGYVVSDYNAKMGTTEDALKAGTHVEMPGWTYYNEKSFDLGIKKGTISKDLINERLKRILEVKLDTSLYNPLTANKPDTYKVEDLRQLARTVAANSMVLLKNNKKLLPLKASQTVALIGPFANGDLLVGNQGSSTVTPERTVTLLQALKYEYKDNIKYSLGCDAMYGEQLVLKSQFKSKASYFDNLDLKGKPVLTRDEDNITKLSFTGSGVGAKTSGVLQNAIAFDGQGSLKIANSPAFSKDEDFTISFWTFLNDQFPDKNAPIISTSIWSTMDIDFTPFSNKIVLNRGSVANGGAANFSVDAEITPQKWVNVLLIRKNGILSVYHNGVLKGKAPFKSPLQSFPVSLGGKLNGTKSASCKIDEVSMFNIALSDIQIAELLKSKTIKTNRVYYESCDDVAALSKSIEKFDHIKDVKQMSVRWDGNFTATQTGKYYFNVASNSGVRFFVDGKKMYDQWQEAWVAGMDRQVWIDMTKGKTYKLTIELSNVRGETGYIRFQYAEPEQAQLANIAKAVALAKTTDVAVVAVGFPQTPMQGESNDNDVYTLTGYQNELVKAVAAANPNTVVLLSTAGGAQIQNWESAVPSIIETFYPGQEGGLAVADVLYGKVNPSGKLPITYPVSTNQLAVEVVQPVYEKTINGFGYRYFDKQNLLPQYPFGFGLSYTTFKYEELKINQTSDKKVVSVTITNTGSVAGAEVVQVYVSEQNPNIERSVKDLKGFSKVFLQPGESKNITVTLPDDAFSYWDPTTKKWTKANGSFNILIGSSSRDIRLQGTL